MNRAVFLDRDGTLIVDRGYLADPEGVELLPGATEGLKRLQDAGFLLIIVSNQSAIARGLCSSEDVEAVNQRVVDELSNEGITITAVEYCPHGPNDNCPCRKPRPDLITRAATKQEIDLAESYMVGDKDGDVMAGLAAGCKDAILITPNATNEPPEVASSLAEAAAYILDKQNLKSPFEGRSDTACRPRQT